MQSQYSANDYAQHIRINSAGSVMLGWRHAYFGRREFKYARTDKSIRNCVLTQNGIVACIPTRYE